jgi:methylenetetrahydrofolate reductase (NADPH)
VVFAQLLREKLEGELIIHITCRDLSRLAIKSRIHALALCGVEHVLALTGDHPRMGPEESAPVFDLDSIRLIHLARIMSDYGVDELGNKLQIRPRMHVGAGLTPYLPLEVEASRALRKLEAGAEFLVTQLVFDAEPIERVLKALKDAGIVIPVFTGLLVAEEPVIQRVIKIMGLPKADAPRGLEKLVDKHVETLKRLRRAYGPVGAFISTLGKIRNLELWDQAFKSCLLPG